MYKQVDTFMRKVDLQVDTFTSKVDLQVDTLTIKTDRQVNASEGVDIMNHLTRKCIKM